jgi:hypothetical protein
MRLDQGFISLAVERTWGCTAATDFVVLYPNHPGRVEGWRRCSVGPAYPLLPFPLGVPHYPDRELVSSPRHIAGSERISRTTRS